MALLLNIDTALCFESIPDDVDDDGDNYDDDDEYCEHEMKIVTAGI